MELPDPQSHLLSPYVHPQLARVIDLQHGLVYSKAVQVISPTNPITEDRTAHTDVCTMGR